MDTSLTPEAYLAHIKADSARFREVLADADPSASVPSCPDWNSDDLLLHLGEVQWFWAQTLRRRPTAPDPETGWGEPDFAKDRAGLLAFFDASSAELQDALATAAPTDAAWTWADDQTVGFILRRQAHEALIHRLDAEQTTGKAGTLDPQLSADGVHEALAVMFAGAPEWGTFTPAPHTVRVELTDTGHELLVQLGRFTGVSPDGVEHDEDDIAMATETNDGGPASAVLAGRAADIDSWLWHRSDESALSLTGDTEAVERFRAVLAQPLD
ncbi:maleylpyruvate isomerase family mycothiol-dependent enzyme [Nocardioides sp. Bht2]|uniref:maleylpyruvate isomerase family mycothiol-dependent enzyme n=1 Tax=Nocardioides sp. Bht2 TaxID=3392297 RepID=UPI0039B6B46C